MTAANATQAVRLSIENAVLIPPPIEPLPADTRPAADDANLPTNLRHLAQAFAARLPIGFGGMAQPGLGEWLYLYRDYNGLPRSFDLASHGREGILSLFAGDARLVARLWPERRVCWHPTAAAETLICHQGRGGVVRGAGFELIAEGVEVQRAHIAISRLAARLLWRGSDPYHVLDLARGWNATRGQGALADEAIEQIVDAACARELDQELRRAG